MNSAIVDQNIIINIVWNLDLKYNQLCIGVEFFLDKKAWKNIFHIGIFLHLHEIDALQLVLRFVLS